MVFGNALNEDLSRFWLESWNGIRADFSIPILLRHVYGMVEELRDKKGVLDADCDRKSMQAPCDPADLRCTGVPTALQ